MQYDIAAKVTLERGKEVILTRFLGVEAEQIELTRSLIERSPSAVDQVGQGVPMHTGLQG